MQQALHRAMETRTVPESRDSFTYRARERPHEDHGRAAPDQERWRDDRQQQMLDHVHPEQAVANRIDRRQKRHGDNSQPCSKGENANRACHPR